MLKHKICTELKEVHSQGHTKMQACIEKKL